jgi:hypothetical protein
MVEVQRGDIILWASGTLQRRFKRIVLGDAFERATVVPFSDFCGILQVEFTR